MSRHLDSTDVSPTRRRPFPTGSVLWGAGLFITFGLGCGGTDPDPDSEDLGSGGTSASSGGGTSTGGQTDGSGGDVAGVGGNENISSGGAAENSGGSGGASGGRESSGGNPGAGGNDGSGGETISDVVPSEGCGKAPALDSGTIDLQSGGTNRTYALRIPDDYDQDHPYRLIFGFHGATGSSSDVAPSYFGLWSLSAGSTIFIAPDAVGGLWSSEADVTFMDDILEQVNAALCIDTTRVELEGFSQGGAMAWTLACARPGVYRAAVVHSGGGLARPETCAPIAFLSSLGQSESNGAGQTSNSDFFAMQNGCTVEALPQAPGGGHACSDYQGCTEPTRWCDYDGGHTPSPNDAGQVTSWMPEEVWSFLSQF